MAQEFLRGYDRQEWFWFSRVLFCIGFERQVIPGVPHSNLKSGSAAERKRENANVEFFGETRRYSALGKTDLLVARSTGPGQTTPILPQVPGGQWNGVPSSQVAGQVRTEYARQNRSAGLAKTSRIAGRVGTKGVEVGTRPAGTGTKAGINGTRLGQRGTENFPPLLCKASSNPFSVHLVPTLRVGKHWMAAPRPRNGTSTLSTSYDNGDAERPSSALRRWSVVTRVFNGLDETLHFCAQSRNVHKSGHGVFPRFSIFSAAHAELPKSSMRNVHADVHCGILLVPGGRAGQSPVNRYRRCGRFWQQNCFPRYIR